MGRPEYDKSLSIEHEQATELTDMIDTLFTDSVHTLSSVTYAVDKEVQHGSVTAQLSEYSTERALTFEATDIELICWRPVAGSDFEEAYRITASVNVPERTTVESYYAISRDRFAMTGKVRHSLWPEDGNREMTRYDYGELRRILELVRVVQRAEQRELGIDR